MKLPYLFLGGLLTCACLPLAAQTAAPPPPPPVANPAASTSATSTPAAPAPVPPPFTSSAAVYSGVSGPGQPVTDDGRGGWVSGAGGVTYNGPNPKPGWHLNWGTRANGSAIAAGVIPPLIPLWNLHLRDTIITLGGDGKYYMTGSTGDNIWDRNDGIELYRSADLKKWDYLGLVWSVEKDGPAWVKSWKTLHNLPVRDVWAPEIHYIKGNYYLAYCMASNGTGILVSQSGKPEGPYVSPLQPDKRLGGGIDATLFQDDDGSVYFTNGGGGTIYKMKADMSGFDGPGHPIKFDPPADGSWTRASIAQEGASLFKANGKYYLGGAGFYKGRYSSVVAISDNIYGPYHDWHEAVPCGGGTNYFQDKDGHWWCAYFGNDDQSPFREKPAALRIEFDKDGLIHIAKKQPDFILQASARGGKSIWSEGNTTVAAPAPATPSASPKPTT
jgi:xylan 1,4-beta-xylosidase